MSIELRKTLPVRVAAALGLSAIAFIVLSSTFFFNRMYRNELRVIDKTLAQLAATVSSSAAIAAYLDNPEIASDVVRGLTQNDIVESAAVVSRNTILKASGGLKKEAGVKLYTFPLTAPFPPEESVGEILIEPNSEMIERRARETAMDQVFNLVVYTLMLLVLLGFITNLLLTSPIRKLARQLHDIEPGSTQRLKPSKWHKNNEIGELIRDTNTLLNSVSATLGRERALRTEIESLERRFRLIFERASGGIALTDEAGRILMFNPSFERLFGERLHQIMKSEDTGFADLFHSPGEVKELLGQVPGSTFPLARDLQISDKEDAIPRWLHCFFSPVTDETGKLLIESILYDVSERRHREQQTRFEAERDPLTGLFNRRAGERLIEQTLGRVYNESCQSALLMIDLDLFKPINDTYGHEAGDRVLVEIARRLQKTVRSSDLVIRWGGDELLIMIVQEFGVPEVTTVARKILNQFSEPIDLGNSVQGRVGASIGIALYPDHGKNADQLIERADQAMYEVKEHGKNSFAFYSAHLQVSSNT